MMKTRNRKLLIDLELLRIQCEGVKEYKAPWLENSTVVMRDAWGRFASKTVSLKKDIEDVSRDLGKGLELATQTVQELVKDEDFRKRAKLSTGAWMLNLIDEAVAKAPVLDLTFSPMLDHLKDETENKLIELYGDDKSAFAQGIRKGRLVEPKKNASLKEKLEFYVTEAQVYKEVLDNPEKYIIPPPPETKISPEENEEQKKGLLSGQYAQALTGVAVAFGIALGWEVAVPLLMTGEFSLGSAAVSAGVSTGLDVAFQKGLEKADIKNPWASFAASFVAGMIGGGAAGLKDAKKINLLKAEAIAIKKAEQEAYEKAFNSPRIKEELIKQGKNVDPEPAAKAAMDRLGFNDCQISYETRAASGDYSQRTLFNNNTSAHNVQDGFMLDTGLTVRNKNGAFSRTIEHVTEFQGSTTIIRKGNKITANLNLTGKTYRIDNRTRPIRSSINLTFDDTQKGRDSLIQLLKANSMPEVDLMSVFERAVMGEKGSVVPVDQSVLMEGLEGVVKKMKGVQPQSEVPELNQLINTLEKNGLPQGDGILVNIRSFPDDVKAFNPKHSVKIPQDFNAKMAKQQGKIVKSDTPVAPKKSQRQLMKEVAERDIKEEEERIAREEAEKLAKEKAAKEARKKAEIAAKQEKARIAREEAEQLARSSSPLAQKIVTNPRSANAQDVIDHIYHPDKLSPKDGDNVAKTMRATAKPAVDDSMYYPKNVKQGEPLTGEERNAIKEYTLNGYHSANIALRDGIDQVNPKWQEETLERINLVNNGLAKLPRMNYKEPFISRFVRLTNKNTRKKMSLEDVGKMLDQNYKVGEEITEKSFLSCSPSTRGTGEFKDTSMADMSVKFLIHSRKQSIARDITQFNQAGEIEALYPPGVKFKVVNKYVHNFDVAENESRKIEHLAKKGQDQFVQGWVVELEEI